MFRLYIIFILLFFISGCGNSPKPKPYIGILKPIPEKVYVLPDTKECKSFARSCLKYKLKSEFYEREIRRLGLDVNSTISN